MLFIQVNLIVMTFITRDALLVAEFGNERAEYAALAIIVSSLVSTPAFALASKVSQLLGRSTTSLLCAGSLVLFYISLDSSSGLTNAATDVSTSFNTDSTTIVHSKENVHAVSSSTSSIIFDRRYLVGGFYVWSDVCVMLLQNEFWEICNSGFKIAGRRIPLSAFE